MIEILQTMPPGVLGLRAHGKVTAADYQEVLIPAVEGALANNEKLRLYYEIAEDFDGFELGAMWEDTKLGLRHVLQWGKIAVVSDLNWMRRTMKGFGLLVPCPVRVYARERMAEAQDWIQEDGTSGMVATLDEESAILTLEPHGQLEKEDFLQLAARVDPFLEEHGDLNGVMIRAFAFPGWDGLGAMFAHLKFVREHQRHVKRLAIVTDDKMLSHMPALAKVFVAAEVKHFAAGEEEQAHAWILQAQDQKQPS